MPRIPAWSIASGEVNLSAIGIAIMSLRFLKGRLARPPDAVFTLADLLKSHLKVSVVDQLADQRKEQKAKGQNATQS